MFSFFLRGLQKPRCFCWQGPPCFRVLAGSEEPPRTQGQREHTASGAATNDRGNSRNAQRQASAVPRKKGTSGAFAKRRCGCAKERCAEAALAHPALPKRSSGKAHSPRLSTKPSTVRRRKVAGFGYRAVHEATDKAKPSFRCSMLIGRDAPNQNALRDPEKQKPPRQREGRSAGGRLQAPDPPPTGWVPNSKFQKLAGL